MYTKALCNIHNTMWLALLFCLLVQSASAQTGEIEITGELKKWHPITLTLDGPFSTETSDPNPFLDYRLIVTFTNGSATYTVPGFFAADGDAANTSAESGTKWRARFTPDATGTWTYTLSFREGDGVAVSDDPNAGAPNSFDGLTGMFTVDDTDKTGNDFKAKGLLRHVGEHFLQFDNGEWFLTNGTGSPENFFGYTEFDNTIPAGFDYRKSYTSHIADWNPGDPTWQDEKGKGIIGAINYLSSQGVNSQYIMIMNTQGDGEETHPWIEREDFYHFDVSKLAQWNIVLEHMNHKGMRPHFILQEMGNDYLLDNGELGTERTMYYRELLARFGHMNGIKWNIGEEHRTPDNGGNTDAQRMDFVNYLTANDPYDHPVVMHTSAGQSNYNALFGPFLGHPDFGGMSYPIHGPTNDGSDTGGGLDTYRYAREWRENSAANGRKWIITLDECCGWNTGVKPDQSNIVSVRKDEMWGTLMAGGSGFDWYLGFESELRDLLLDDSRRYQFLWDISRYATDFFREYVPFVDMIPVDDLTPIETNRVLEKPGELYVVYLRDGGTTTLDLQGSTESFMVDWYNPRTGGELISGAVTEITGPGVQSLGSPPFDTGDDWVVLVRSEDAISPVVARFSAEPSELFFSIDFDASTSTSTDAAIVSYEWNYGDGTSGSGIETSHTYPAPGFYTVTLTVTDGLGNTDDQVQTIEVEDPSSTGAFLEEDGLLVIEAEHFEENVTRNGQTWTEATTFTGFEGSGAMAALPDNGQIYNMGYGSSSPYMNLLADFTNTGTFYVWTRVRAVSSGNTLHVGLNETETTTAEALESNNFSGWEWIRTRKNDGGNAFVDINTPGEQNITIWMREDGIHLDRILLTTDANFIPTGGGPAESPRAGAAPTAAFTATPTSGVAPLTVDFDASSSTPPIGNTITTYTWNFGDGTTGMGEFTSHTFTTEGTYTVSLIVESSNGNADVTTTTITVDPAPAGDPVAEFTATPLTGTAPLDVSFDGSLSTPPVGETISSYDWDFGDGNAGSGESISHTYAAEGTYTATLTVTASNGNSDVATTTITVDPAPSEDPVASFTATPETGIVPLEVSFDASASTPPVGETITAYDWDYGDGNTGNGETVTHTYAAEGTYTATLTVTASNGNTDVATTTITVDPIPVEDPVAAFTATPTSGVEPLEVDFDASGSTPPEGATIDTYAWDFGDGNAGNGETTTHTYAAAGSYTATLTVTDSNGNSDTASETITVDPDIPPPGDGAFIEVDGLLVIEAENYVDNITRNGQTWTEDTTFPDFEGTTAMAALPDNNETYANGYGTTSPYMNYLASFTNTGTYNVWVRVRAVSNGNTIHVGLNETETPSAEAIGSRNLADWSWTRSRLGQSLATVDINAAGEQTITVWMRQDGIYFDRILLTTDDSFVPTGAGPPESERGGDPDPVASFTFTPDMGIAPLEVSFDASGSTAPDGATITSYDWDFGDSNAGSGETPTHTYVASGSFTISLTVTDSNGNTDTATNSIDVSDPPSDDPVAIFTATPDNGEAPLDVSFDGSDSMPPDGATITDYDWDFGDGNSGTGETTTHTYTTAGTYTATLTVTDSGGNQGSASNTITVTDPPPPDDPVAAFTATPESGIVPLDVDFDASGSTATDGATITSYDWDFGDSNSGSGETISHTFNTVGSFTVTLTVTDSNGNTDTETATITVNSDDPGDEEMHVSSITTQVIRAAGRTAFGEAVVTIVDEAGNPVADATVSGTFSGDVTGQASVVTSADGTATLESDIVTVRPFVVDFCVDDVTHATFVYNPATNDDPGFACPSSPLLGAKGGQEFSKQKEALLPTEYAISSYPNPFNTTATLKLDLPEAGDVLLKVYNALGQEVETLIAGYKEAGSHVIQFDARSLSNGLYIYTVQANAFRSTKTMLLVR